MVKCIEKNGRKCVDFFCGNVTITPVLYSIRCLGCGRISQFARVASNVLITGRRVRSF